MSVFEWLTIIISGFALAFSIFNLWQNERIKRRSNKRYLAEKKLSLLKDLKSYDSELSIMYSSLLLVNMDEYPKDVQKVISSAKQGTLDSLDMVNKIKNDIEKTDCKEEDKIQLFQQGISEQLVGHNAIKTMIKNGLEKRKK